MTPLRCQGCGGPFTISRDGQTIILPAITMTETGHVIQGGDDGWCADCIDAWNQAMTRGER